MMTDWQVGDLALCVAGAQDCPIMMKHTGLEIGKVYTVARVGVVPDYQRAPTLALGLDGFPRGEGKRASLFRKITPDTADEFDREVIALLTGKPEQVTG